MTTDFEKVSLANLARGAAHEKFDIELQKAIDNIMDPNFGAGPRKVFLEVIIRPAENKMTAEVTVNAHSKLVQPLPVATRFYLGRPGGLPTALEHRIEQQNMFPAAGVEDVPAGKQTVDAAVVGKKEGGAN